MRRYASLLVTILLSIPGVSGQALAQDVGDEVVPKSEVKLKIKSEVIEVVGSSDVLTVELIRDEWLWVRTAAGNHGWVKAAAVDLRQETAPRSPEDPTPATSDLPEAAQDAAAQRLYLIGAIGGPHIYTTYAYIGVLADSLSKDLYTVEQVRELLNETVAMSESLLKHLHKVRDGGLSDEDARAVDEMIAIYKLLQDEARAATALAASKNGDDVERFKEDAEKFDKIRMAVWPRIANLLGFEQPAPEAEHP